MKINQFTPKWNYIELEFDSKTNKMLFNHTDFCNKIKDMLYSLEIYVDYNNYDVFMENGVSYCLVSFKGLDINKNNKYLVWSPYLTKHGVNYEYSFLNEQIFKKLIGE